MTPRNSGFTVVCEDTCSFLTFNEEIYQKYIKKLLTKQIDEQIHILKTNALFHDVGTLNLRKYCSYFVKKSYKYNEVVYSPHSATEYIYFILKGEVQLNHQHSEKNINVVRLIQGECFGFENDQFGEVKSYAKNVSPELSVLRIHIFIFQAMMK
jgi:CRP-like cAMP-binding protein